MEERRSEQSRCSGRSTEAEWNEERREEEKKERKRIRTKEEKGRKEGENNQRVWAEAPERERSCRAANNLGHQGKKKYRVKRRGGDKWGEES